MHVVFFNILFSVMLFASVGFYQFVFPKKRIPLFVLVILISFLPVLSIFRFGTYESGDLSVNAVKTMEFYHSLQEGHFIPRWAADLNGLYGYPLFIYTYPLPYYFASLFHFLGFGFIDSVKGVLIVSFLLSGIAMFLYLRSFLEEISAFVGSIFYLFAPYHLVDLHFRVDIGEISAFVFLPLIFYGIKKQLIETKIKWQLVTVFSVCGLLLSHQAVSLIFLPLSLLYAFLSYFFQTKKLLRKLLFVLISILWGGLLASFYVLPVLWESRITLQSHVASVYFFPWWDYLFSPYRFGFLFQGHHGELSFLVGYTELLVVGFGIYLLWRKKIEKKYQYLFYFSLSSFFVLFLFMQGFTAPLWNVLPLFKNFQFSYRLMVGIVFFVAILGAISARYITSNRLLILLCMVTIFSTILNWGNRRVIPEITDAVLQQTLPESSARAEGLFPALPEWVNRNHPWMDKRPKTPITILKGKADVKYLARASTYHTYIISAQNSLTAQENTLYYPGWTVSLDGKRVPISYRAKGNPGIIRFQIEKGVHYVRVVFLNTPDRIAGQLISLTAIGLGLLYVILRGMFRVRFLR